MIVIYFVKKKKKQKQCCLRRYCAVTMQVLFKIGFLVELGFSLLFPEGKRCSESLPLATSPILLWPNFVVF
jgi:hypothetical protein